MKAILYGQYLDDKNITYVDQCFEAMKALGFPFAIYKTFDEVIKGKVKIEGNYEIITSREGLLEYDPDVCITLGGDGTILKAATLIRDSQIPILGINLGRLGFLASTEKTSIQDALEMILKNEYSIDRRSMLRLESNIPIFGDLKFALNDFTLHKRDTSSMITVHTYLNDEFLNSYWADGLIVSTPTGSTGYSLSCGGPIIYPNSNNFVITPVAPHNLNVRPLVFSDDIKISFEIEGRSESFLCTLDSRFERITAEHKISITKNNFTTNLVKLHSKSFLKTIREKLVWGRDSRNAHPDSMS